MNKMKNTVVKESKQKIFKAENPFCAIPVSSLSLADFIYSPVKFVFALL